MPQDNTVELIKAINLKDSVKVYRCSQGHLYTIGECGKPMQLARCSQCGEQIGGTSHKLVDSSAPTEAVDQTLPGYCYAEHPLPVNNDQQQQKQTSSSQVDETLRRRLNNSGFYLERFLINACMYLAIGDHDERIEAVKQIMTFKEPNPKDFFWKHMIRDLHLAASSLNLNVDEVMLLWHLVCAKFIDSSIN